MPDARMTAPVGKTRALTRLLKAVLSGARLVEAGSPDGGLDGGAGATVDRQMAIETADGRRLPVGEDVLTAAARAGLLRRDGVRLLATRETETALRRALAAPDEAFLDQHRCVEEAVREGPEGPARLAVNRTESPLAMLARLKERDGAPFFAAEAIAAGERLHADFTRAQLQPRLTMIYAPPLPGGSGQGVGKEDLSDSALSARLRVRRAVEAMGPELSGVALDICCFEKGLETVERERLWPVRSAKVMLRAALMALARHYAPPRSSGQRQHSWGTDDFRPTL
ncbi:hypothetical protein SAMN05880582_10789 [Rhizobium sp. RU20A]|uniref:DUF6456 domain-containing protein n=1 Tax=Rhizobium sp. RU20A TaxID=1907412 RepID=UPI0009563849|nr:DUF6456 domain-containing protein [Rhizobium sp. RU20A]SIR16537.1 hypothetical protein SAMN05880582_10789 [Rhizobium sp. RU20A]